MGFMEQAAAKLSTKYGTVAEGKHKGCQIALGNDPSQKVELTDGFSQIIFVDGTEEKGRYNIAGGFQKIEILSSDEKGLQMKLNFADGEMCSFLLETAAAKKESVVVSIMKIFTNQYNLPPEQKKKENFRHLKVFMRNTMPLLTLQSLVDLMKYYNANKIMEKADLEVFEQCKKAFE